MSVVKVVLKDDWIDTYEAIDLIDIDDNDLIGYDDAGVEVMRQPIRDIKHLEIDPL